MAMKVVYGHTDSIYVQMPIDKAEETLDLLNNHVRGLFPNVMGLDEHPVKLEFEKYFSTLGVGKTKNRNAGLISWKDGKYLEDEEFTMTGFTAKRQAITPLAKTVQMDLLKKWVDQIPEAEISNWLNEEYHKVMSGKMETSILIQRSRYRPERLTYMCDSCNKQYTWREAVDLRLSQDTQNNFCDKCGNTLELVTLEGKNPGIGAGVEGLIWHNQNYTEQIEDSYLYMRVLDNPNRVSYMHPITGQYKRPTYISALTAEELLQHTPDYRHYADSILKKAEPVYKAMGWDMSAIEIDRNQRGLGEWW
tara:strand:+ start:1248 stop:2165 length:918 start_codon:yes stop_codon:yes gene_type:complete